MDAHNFQIPRFDSSGELFMKVTEDGFKVSATALFPPYIACGDFIYMLHPYALLAGGFRITYVCPHADIEYRIAFDEMDENPFDCLKYFSRNLNRGIMWREATKAEYDAQEPISAREI